MRLFKGGPKNQQNQQNQQQSTDSNKRVLLRVRLKNFSFNHNIFLFWGLSHYILFFDFFRLRLCRGTTTPIRQNKSVDTNCKLYLSRRMNILKNQILCFVLKQNTIKWLPNIWQKFDNFLSFSNFYQLRIHLFISDFLHRAVICHVIMRKV